MAVRACLQSGYLDGLTDTQGFLARKGSKFFCRFHESVQVWDLHLDRNNL